MELLDTEKSQVYEKHKQCLQCIEDQTDRNQIDMPRSWLRARTTSLCIECQTPIEIGDQVYPCAVKDDAGVPVADVKHFRSFKHLECAKQDEATLDSQGTDNILVHCKHFQRGHCLYGDKCIFLHDASFVSTSQGQQSQKQRPNGSGKKTYRNKTKNRFRAAALRRWLIDTFGREKLQQGTGVLDIAGGMKAEVSFEFVNLNRIPATILEPRLLDLTKPASWLKLGIYHSNPIFQQYVDVPYSSNPDVQAPKHLRCIVTADICKLVTGSIASWPRKFDAMLDTLGVDDSEEGSDYDEEEASKRLAGIKLSDDEDTQQEDSSSSYPSSTSKTPPPGWNEAWKRSVEDARNRRWTPKGLVQHAENENDGQAIFASSTLDSSNDNTDNTSINTKPAKVHVLGAIEPIPVEEIEDSEEAWRLLTMASVIIAMHADQATEFAVDLALHHNIPFAVVPCCVFTSQFPRRGLPDGGEVNSYDKLIEYLVAKNPDLIRVAELPFQGRNKVVYKL